ncbi:hypothetical protein [Paenibacillus herberti]|uniref:hypothetical protein n=1 Tax=Paenibacillus herberti TaxID=1619309 RepID=UPI001FE8706C|nr:hypothetical protein [Paenibacillus herberti]
MKLQHQINLAFGLLLVFVLGFAAILIHFVLMDYLVTTQKQEMRSISTALAAKLEASGSDANAQSPEPSNNKEDQDPPLPRTETGETATIIEGLPTDSSQMFDAYSGMEVYLVDESGKILRESSGASGLPEGVVRLGAPAVETDSNQSRFDLAFGSSNRYLSDVIKVPQGNLALVKPFSQIKEVEQALMGRLLLVLIAGGVVAFLLSLLLTRKLISPLVRLRGELKKVRERRFGEVALVKAGGEIGAVARTVHELAGELDRYNRRAKAIFPECLP